MTEQIFENQIERLSRKYGQRHYCQETQKLLYDVYKDVDGEAFTDAVSELIVTQRAVPLKDEIGKAVTLAEERVRQQRAYDAKSQGGVLEHLLHVGDRSVANEIKDIAMQAIKKILTGKPRNARFTEEDKQYLFQAHELQMTILRQKPPKNCSNCIDGLVFSDLNNNRYVSRCRCGLGNLHPNLPETKQQTTRYQGTQIDVRLKQTGEKEER